MTYFDYFIIATLAISAIISLFRGFLKEVISLGSWLIAVWAAFTFSESLAPKIVAYIPFIDDLPLGKSIIVQTLISGAIIFFVIIAIGAMINFILSKAVEKTGLSGSDRFLGMLFGVLRGALVVSLATLFISNSSVAQKEQWWINSQLKPHALKTASLLQSLVPEQLKSYLPGNGETILEEEPAAISDLKLDENLSPPDSNSDVSDTQKEFEESQNP